jgi:hypothetical protein
MSYTVRGKVPVGLALERGEHRFGIGIIVLKQGGRLLGKVRSDDRFFLFGARKIKRRIDDGGKRRGPADGSNVCDASSASRPGA